MNKQKLVLLSLILPVLVSGSIQANPWKNTLKKAGYAGAAVIALYTGYQAAKAYGLFGQSEQPAQNNLPIPSLEDRQNEVIRLRDDAGRKKAAYELEKQQLASQLATAQENQQRISRSAEQRIAALETQEASVQSLLAQRTKDNTEQLKEIDRLATLNTNLLAQLSKAQATTPSKELPVTIATSALPGEQESQPIFDLKDEYIKVLRTSAINVGSMIHASKKAFDAIAPFIQQHYANDQVLINWGTTYEQIRTCQNVMEEFNQMLKENNNDFSKPEVLKQAETALTLVYSACQSINRVLPLYRSKIAEKASTSWTEWFKGKDAQILEEFDSFILSFEQRLKQLKPIKDNSLTQ